MLKQFLKFGVIGVINTVITVITYQLLIYSGINHFVANTAGYLLGTINSYFFNNYWVFQAKDKSKEVFSKFIMVNFVTLCISNLLLFIFVDKLHYRKDLVQIFVIPITMVFNFILNKFWTFKRRNTN